MRFLLLANGGDATAARIAAALRARHAAGTIALVTMRDLAQPAGLTHALSGDCARTVIRLRSGAVLDSDDIGVVLNRLRHVIVPQFARSPKADSDYATMEVYALLISWLTSLRCPIVNRGGSSGLSAVPRSAFEWFRLAADAGLQTPRLCVSTSLRRFPVPDLIPLQRSPHPYDAWCPGLSPAVGLRRGWFVERVGGRRCSLYIAGSQVYGVLPDATKRAARRLAERAAISLARVDFCESAHAPGQWVFVGIDEWPDLFAPESIDAAVSLLEELA